MSDRQYTARIDLKATRDGFSGEVRIAAEDMEALNAEIAKTKGAAEQGAEGLKKYADETGKTGEKTKTLGAEVKKLFQEWFSVKGLLGTVGIASVGQQLVTLTAQSQNTRTMLQGLTADSRDYAEVQSYLKQTAGEYSQSLLGLSQHYGRILALQNADLVSKAEGRQILEGLIDVVHDAGKNGQELEQIITGITRGLSDGIVNIQEFQTSVKPVPALLHAVANAAGMGSEQLMQLVMSGRVTSAMYKTYLIDALETFDGASARVHDNISLRAHRARNAHLALAQSLESQVDATWGEFLDRYADGVETVADKMPTLIELTKDLLFVMGALAAIRITVWMNAFRLSALEAAMQTNFLGQRIHQAGVASVVATRGVGVLSAGLRLIGGYGGLAVLAATAIYAFGKEQETAEERTARLREEIDSLARSMTDLTATQVQQRISAQEQIIAMNEAMKEALVEPKPIYGNDRSPVASNQAAIETYRQQIASLNQDIATADAVLAALRETQTKLDERRAGESATAAQVLADRQKELLDQYAPLQALTRDYQADLTALTSIVTVSAEQERIKQEAIEGLTAAYKKEADSLTVLTASEVQAQQLREKQVQSMRQLIDEHAPLENVTVRYREELRLLHDARALGLVGLEGYRAALISLGEDYEATINPAGALVVKMQEELRVMKLSDIEREFANRTRGMTVAQVQEQEGSIRALIIQMRAEQIALDALEADQQFYAQTTENMLEGLQRSWADLFSNILKNGKFTMRTLQDSMATIMADTVGQMWAHDLSGAFKGAFQQGTPGAGGKGASPTVGGSGFDVGSLTAVLGAGIYNILDARILQTTAPVYEGGVLIKEGAQSLNFSMKNIGTNIVSGIAGSYVGTKLGEAVFGKTANSNYGAIIGGTIGSIVPVIGTFVGSMIGSMADVLFGGDGWKRQSIGFDAGPPSVRDDYIYGSETFSSGLTVGKVNRRGDQAASQAIVDKGREIDAFIFNEARAAGYNLDARGKSLQGVNADYGYNNGSFFGMRVGDGVADTEEALDAMFASFSTQLIGHIEGLSADVATAMTNATGTTDEILQQFRDTLALDKLVQTGGLDVLKTTMTFTLAQQLAEAAGGIENLTIMTQAFNAEVVDESVSIENAIARLRQAVGDQFTALDLQLADFTTVTAFREYFDAVKDTLTAADVIKLVQAGNALDLLIDKETELGAVRAETVEETLKGLDLILDSVKTIRSQAQALAGTLQDDIYKLSGSNVTDLRSRLRTGTLDQQLDTIGKLRQAILEHYNAELQIAEELHQVKLDQYEEQLDAARSLSDYITDLMTSDLSPLTVADRLVTAQDNFDAIVGKARGGDLNAGLKAQDAFETLAKLNQTANASSIEGVTVFYANLAKLEEVRDLLAAAQQPAEFSNQDLLDGVLQEMRDLQAEVANVQWEIGEDITAAILSQTELLNDLPMDIAEAIDFVTGLSQHPTQLAALMGAMISMQLAAGTPRTLVADNIARDATATAATNRWLADTGRTNAAGAPATVADYQSSVNLAITDQQIRDAIEEIKANSATEAEALYRIGSLAIQHGVGSRQIALAIDKSQDWVLSKAASVGLPAFLSGTDRIERDGPANMHREEIVFDPPRASVIRDAVVKRMTSDSPDADVGRLARAVEHQTALLTALIEQLQGLTAEQQVAFTAVAGEIRESVDRLSREIEDMAA